MKKFCLTLLIGLLFSINAVAENTFKLTDLDGKTHQLSHYQGQWLLVNFWATWCGPCIRELPELVNLHQARQTNNLQVLSIAVDSGTADKVLTFADELKVNFPIINWNWQQNAAMDKQINQAFGDIEAIPTTFLFNPDGKLVAQERGGEVTQADIEAYIRRKGSVTE